MVDMMTAVCMYVCVAVTCRKLILLSDRECNLYRM